MEGARLSVRNEAARQGQPVPEVQGVQHQRSEPYMMRVHARSLQDACAEVERQWWEEEPTTTITIIIMMVTATTSNSNNNTHNNTHYHYYYYHYYGYYYYYYYTHDC